MTLAEQIADLETDHAGLLTAKQDLEARVAELEAENARLMIQCDAMVRFTAGTRAMVETLAQDALAALRASRREAYEKPQGEGVEAFKPRQAPLSGAAQGTVREVREVLEQVGQNNDTLPLNLSAATSTRTVKNVLDAPAREGESAALGYLRRDSSFDVDFVDKPEGWPTPTRKAIDLDEAAKVDPYTGLAAEITAAHMSGGRITGVRPAMTAPYAAAAG